jgi:hypothetical protein
MIYSGIADTYRNEQFIKKSDFLYNAELLLVHANLNSLDKQKVVDNLLILELLLFSNLYDKYYSKQ